MFMNFVIVLLGVIILGIGMSRVIRHSASIEVKTPAASSAMLTISSAKVDTDQARVYTEAFPWGQLQREIKNDYGGSRDRHRLSGFISVIQRDGATVLVWSNRIPEQLLPPHVISDLRKFIADSDAVDRREFEK